MKRLTIKVRGIVQGVHFRASTKAVADQLGVKGLVCNLPDGAVYIEAEGDHFSLGTFVEWCHEGPERAKVASVEQTDMPVKNDRNFEVVKRIPNTNTQAI